MKTSLTNAKKRKYDEFYTQEREIHSELCFYKEHFRDKTVYCNCDHHEHSNFFKYFFYNFNRWYDYKAQGLGLKRLIATAYAGDADVFKSSTNRGVYAEYLGNGLNVNAGYLYGNGDFRSEECVELLKQSDIVVTNPPFSLFREYMSQLIKYEKKFLILGDINAVGYKDIFPLFQQNKIRIGIHSGDMWFEVPHDYPGPVGRIDESGRKYVSMRRNLWYTNLKTFPIHARNCDLRKEYNPTDYPKYDNLDAINVDKVADIPKDYDGVMGVPITFMQKYHPDQFIILGHRYGADRKNLSVNGKAKFERILIKRK